ncbi:MAG: hypothetical protein DLM72_08280 [Candidatus Nitrosopolaris wilkensis]|nr:MAG: hypothetical protein DLM72_08280 [Candidatus Nitrosopolaris wilkensis]
MSKRNEIYSTYCSEVLTILVGVMFHQVKAVVIAIVTTLIRKSLIIEVNLSTIIMDLRLKPIQHLKIAMKI